MSGKRFVHARLCWRKPLSADTFLLGLDAPDVAEKSLPGQFVHVRVPKMVDPLLPRPFSIAGAGPLSTSGQAGIVELLVKRRGKGTRILTELDIGAEVTVLGPIGNHFDPDARTRNLWMIAGGVGLAPFIFLSTFLAGERRDIHARLFYGCRGADDALDLDPVHEAGIAVEVASEDGACGRQGMVSELTAELLDSAVPDALEMLACGPHPMMLAVAAQARRVGAPCRVSLENFMACGMGVCQGCVVSLKGEADGEVVYERVCHEGPVFDAQRLVETLPA